MYIYLPLLRIMLQLSSGGN